MAQIGNSMQGFTRGAARVREDVQGCGMGSVTEVDKRGCVGQEQFARSSTQVRDGTRVNKVEQGQAQIKTR